eukprot:CAMPEP_0174855702 /NCGR_PEP_ID=MMETSP1114-20130205/33991_1 /TAXON_ID=312471 /ORGANISM="Neobodo designis, Strain CCAP 1951/1" /LENGTH=787 /DNA_ID=CAMNT_0016090457 /DNA_START=45 /DNA_END=2404 /DNA_ORIENTATION=+
MVCCGPSDERPEGTVPKLKLPPSALAKMIKLITGAGVEVAKLTSGGQPRQKAVVLDRRMEYYTFLPSKKAYEDRQYPVKNIASILVGNEVTQKLIDNNFDDSTFCFAFILADGTDVNFVCNDEAQRDQLVDLFSFLVRRQKVMLDESPHRVRLMNMWLKADSDGNGRLTFDELARALQELNVNMERGTMRKLFMGVDKDGSGTLDFDEFIEFFDDLTLRPELKGLFEKFAGDGGDQYALEPDEFRRFLKVCQLEDVSEVVAAGLCRRFGEGQPAMSLNDFCRYMVSAPENPALNPMHVPEFETVDRPLHHYNIVASSGADLQSTSSIKSVLRHGIRALHLKVVMHENRPVLVDNKDLGLESLFRCINEAAFESSEYPVIISLSGEWKVVRMATGVAKRYISRRTLLTVPELEKQPQKALTPHTLSRKIILVGFVEPEAQADMWATEELGVIRGVSAAAAASELDDMGTPFELRHSGNNAMLQVDAALLTERPEDIKKWSRDGLVVADAPFRGVIDMMRAGAQICPARWTAWSEQVASVSTYFHLNGMKGYRVRPASVLNETTVDENGEEELPPLTNLTVRVLLGTQIPQSKQDAGGRDIVDPFVRVSVIGERRDQEANTVGNTPYIADNGFTPVWDEEFQFAFRYADQAVLKMKIFDYNTTESHGIAEAYIPLASLRQGYRAVAFRAVDGEALPHTSIVCHFRFRGQPVSMPGLLPMLAESDAPVDVAESSQRTSQKATPQKTGSAEEAVAAETKPAIADPAPAVVPAHTAEPQSELPHGHEDQSST